MPDTKIAYINYYMPSNKVSVKDYLGTIGDDDIPRAFPGKDAYAEFIKEELEVEAIRVEDKLRDQEMLVNTVEQLFIDGAADPTDIDLIILAQEDDQRQKLNLGQFIQYEFELNNAYVLTVSGNHCANIDHAINLATQLGNKNDRLNNILILGSVKIDNPVHRLVGTYGIISDGAGVMLLNKGDKGLTLQDCKAVSAGRFHDINLDRDDSLILLKYYVKTIKELLGQASVTDGAIDHIITQNANPLLITQALHMAGLDVVKIFSENKSRYSHLDCLDVLVNLKDLIKQLEANHSQGQVLTFGTGWAGSFISSLYAYNYSWKLNN
ncbi:MAG: hypothetical protein ABIN67_19775 [Ferruginibacter sp.]